MGKNMKIFNGVMNETDYGRKIPTIDKNGVSVRKLAIFKDICLRNMNNLDGIALEINGNQITYRNFFMEVERYMKSFQALGVKEGTVVSLCLPVSVEFICSYFALSTMGAVCNSLNIGFLIRDDVKSYTDDRCSDIFVCYDKYYELLKSRNAFEGSKLGKLILTSDCTYAHYKSDSNRILVPDNGIKGVDILTLDDFFINNGNINTVSFDEDRASIFTYTSGTTGRSKCMAHSDLAPLFMSASHDLIDRPNEIVGDRTLVTIPFAHPTGLFYSMVLQLAEGKTLVLEPRYDKRLFHSDIRDLKINHAVQAKPFYAQLVQDRANGLIRPGDFELFKSPYSGGEGIPLSVCRDINATLKYAGCNESITVGYGRSEEGSICLGAYNISGRENTVGLPIPGVFARIVDPITKEFISPEVGKRGEIQLSSPVMPLGNHYLGINNIALKPDCSIVDNDGRRWSSPGDIATVVACGNELSYLVLGRCSDSVIKDGKTIYLFDLKEQISNLKEIQECEVISLGEDDFDVTVHVVVKDEYKENIESLVQKIMSVSEYIDGVKFYDVFGINATSGKCDKSAMKNDKSGYVSYRDGEFVRLYFGGKSLIKNRK